MGLQTKKILGFSIAISPKEEILEEIRKYLEKAESGKRKAERNNQKPFVIFTLNPEIINFAQKDINFAQIVNTAQINLPDGIGIILALKKLYRLSIKKVGGIDFMLDLCNLANREGFTVGLIGGRRGVALETRECLLRSFPKIKIEVLEAPEIEISNIKYQKSKINIKNQKLVSLKTPRGWQADPPAGGEAMTPFRVNLQGEPPMVEEAEKSYFTSLANKIIEQKIDILFVALGHPKQEYFIDLINQQLAINNYQFPIVLMAVGGSFDYISGRVPRAPEWMRNMGLEWLFRLIMEPWRLGRQLRGAEFFWKVMREKS